MEGGFARVQYVDVDPDALLDGENASNLSDSLDDFATFANDATNIFRVGLNGDGDKAVFLGFLDGDILRMGDDIRDDIF